MIKIQEVKSIKQKATICHAILVELPSWFGIEESIIEYVKEVQKMKFFVAFHKENPVGFIAIKEHNPFTAEIYVMGILKEYHRQGIGKKLIEASELFCKCGNMEYLTVKTVDESREDRYYEKTRQFYLNMNFRPLEVFPLLWDESNPCLFMVKYLG